MWKKFPKDERYEVSEKGEVRMVGKSQLRKPTTTPAGYQVLVVAVPGEGKRRRGWYVHRMVLEAFVGPCPEGMEASHLNGVRWDNRLSNLAWETAKQNHARKVAHKTDFSGERNPAARLKPESIAEIRGSLKTERELAEMYGVSRATIGRVRRGESWKSCA